MGKEKIPFKEETKWMGAGSTEEEREELLLTSVTQISSRKLMFGWEMQYFAILHYYDDKFSHCIQGILKRDNICSKKNMKILANNNLQHGLCSFQQSH